MPAWLNAFLKQAGTSEPWSRTDTRSLYCIIDSVRQPNALEQLYQQDGLNGIERLFQDTPFAEMNEVSPLWLPLKPGSAVATKAVELCRTNRSGILLTTDAKPEKALLHAQRLLRMNSNSHGDALARYYDPAFWGALALTTSAKKLMGPWINVYTPPAHSSDRLWRMWGRPEQEGESIDDGGYPLLLQDRTMAASSDIRWWYWIRARKAESGNDLSDEQLPLVLDNLKLLVEHGIDESRHLERLLSHIVTRPLQENPELMNVLSSDLPAFEKVQRLEV